MNRVVGHHLIVLGVALSLIAGCGRPSADSDPSATSRPAESGGSDAAGQGVGPLVSDATEIATSYSEKRRRQDESLLSAKQDGWQTEAFVESALKELKQLGRRLNAQEPSAGGVGELVASDVLCTDLRPTDLKDVYHDKMLTVRRPVQPQPSPPSPKQLADGLDALRAAMAASEIESHFKIVAVDGDDSTMETTVIVELHGTSDSRSHQINATWLCEWTNVPGESPHLKSIQVVDYEEAEVRLPKGQWFADYTQAILGQSAAYRDQLAFGHHYWLQRIERVQRFDTAVRNGLAIGDVNGDGLDDLYVCQPPGLPNRLFVQNADGTATDHSAEAGVDWLDQTSAALFCDLDNDDDQDLILGTPTGLLLLSNDALGKFSLRATLEIDYDVHSLSAVDYDNDGRLDLFVCIYRTALPSSDATFLYRDAVGGGKNRLYRSEIQGDQWRFEDVTETSGLDAGADRYSQAASWEDYDRDGDPDLYVANDFGPNYLYENRDGKFINVAARAGVVDIGSGMSASWGDYNRDGRMDLYVGNMFSSAGQRITGQSKFRPGEDPGIRQIYQRLAKGNSLFTNQGDGTFREVGAEARVELGRWAWSSLFVDLNNDAWEDLLVANGYMTTEDTGDL